MPTYPRVYTSRWWRDDAVWTQSLQNSPCHLGLQKQLWHWAQCPQEAASMGFWRRALCGMCSICHRLQRHTTSRCADATMAAGWQGLISCGSAQQALALQGSQIRAQLHGEQRPSEIKRAAATPDQCWIWPHAVLPGCSEPMCPRAGPFRRTPDCLASSPFLLGLKHSDNHVAPFTGRNSAISHSQITVL